MLIDFVRFKLIILFPLIVSFISEKKIIGDLKTISSLVILGVVGAIKRANELINL